MYEISWFFLWKFNLISTFTLKLNFLGVLTIFFTSSNQWKFLWIWMAELQTLVRHFFFTQNCLPLFSNWLIWMWISNPMWLICRIFPPKGDIAFSLCCQRSVYLIFSENCWFTSKTLLPPFQNQFYFTGN